MSATTDSMYVFASEELYLVVPETDEVGIFVTTDEFKAHDHASMLWISSRIRSVVTLVVKTASL